MNEDNPLILIIIISVIVGIFCGITVDAEKIISDIFFGVFVTFLSFFSLTSAFMK